MIDSSLEEAVRLSDLAEDLLTLARSDAGVMEPRLETVDLAERLRAAIERLQSRIAAKELNADEAEFRVVLPREAAE